jgi:hypothetical protein
MLDTRAATAERLWTGSQSDAGLLADLRTAYRGRFDVVDALWWRAHPLVPTPSGVTDPAAELETLAAAVYSRGSALEPLVDFVDPVSGRTVRATENGRRLRMLTIALAEDAIALDTAIEYVSERLDLRPHRQQPSEPYAPSAGSVTSPSSAQRVRRTIRPRLRIAALALAGVVLAGVGISTAILKQATDADVGAGVLQIFTDHARYPVGITPDLGDRFNPESIRSVTPPGAAEAGYALYVAQNIDGDFCVVLRNLDRILDTRCASAVEIASTGLRLDAVVIPPPSPTESSRSPTLIDVTVIWTTKGEFAASFTPRSSPHEY